MPAAAAACATPRTATYRRRQPERSVLYRTVQTHLATWLELAQDESGRSTPAHVEREFRRYLECGPSTGSGQAFWPTASHAPGVPAAGTTSWSPTRARGAASAPPAIRAAWSRPPPTLPTTSFRACRFGNGCSRCPPKVGASRRTAALLSAGRPRRPEPGPAPLSVGGGTGLAGRLPDGSRHPRPLRRGRLHPQLRRPAQSACAFPLRGGRWRVRGRHRGCPAAAVSRNAGARCESNGQAHIVFITSTMCQTIRTWPLSLQTGPGL